MFSYWMKNRFLFTFILTATISVLVGFFFVVPNIKNAKDNALKTSVYEKTEIDFDIPAPTKEQLNEIQNMDFIDFAFGYYYTETSVKANGKNITQKVIFSDCMDNVEITMFNINRVIEVGNADYNNPIYVDYDFVKKAGVGIGDEIELNNIKFQVAAIYESNTYNNAILAPLVGEQKTLIENKNNGYSGAFLKVNDYTKADSYLKSYKPLGRLKDKDSFESEDEYNIHYSAWESANYYNEVTSFKRKLDGVNLAPIISKWFILGVYAVVSLLINIILFIRKSEKKYFREKKFKKHIVSYYFLTLVEELIVAVGCYFALVAMTIRNSDDLLTANTRQECLFLLVGFSAVAVVNYVINLLLLRMVANENK